MRRRPRRGATVTEPYYPKLNDLVTVVGSSCFSRLWLKAIGIVVPGHKNEFAVEMLYAPNHPGFDASHSRDFRVCSISNPDYDLRLASESEREASGFPSLHVGDLVIVVGGVLGVITEIHADVIGVMRFGRNPTWGPWRVLRSDVKYVRKADSTERTNAGLPELAKPESSAAVRLRVAEALFNAYDLSKPSDQRAFDVYLEALKAVGYDGSWASRAVSTFIEHLKGEVRNDSARS